MRVRIVPHGDADEVVVEGLSYIPKAITTAPDAQLKAVWAQVDKIGVRPDGTVFYTLRGYIFPREVAGAVARFVERALCPLLKDRKTFMEAQVMSSVFADILQPQPREEAAAEERPLTVVLTTGEELNALLREQGVTMRAEGGDVICNLTPQVRIRDAAKIAESTIVQVKVFAERVEVAPLTEGGGLTAALTLNLDELKAWAAKIFR